MTEPRRDDLPAIDPAFLRGLTMRRMSRRDLLRSAGVGAGALCGARSSRRAAGRAEAAAAAAAATRRRRSGGHRLERRAERHAELRELAALHRQGEGERPGDRTRRSSSSRTDTGIEVNVPGGDQRQRRVLRQDPAAAAGRAVDRLGHHRHHERHELTSCSGWTTWYRCSTDKRPNFDANASVAVKDPAYDPGNKYTMAWQSGFTGIGWDPDRSRLATVEARDHEREGSVRTRVRGQGRHVQRQRGHAEPGDGRLGIEPDDVDPGRLAGGRRPAAEAEGRRDRPRSTTTRATSTRVENGDIAVTMAWSGDIFQLNLEGDASGLQFCVPEEGVMIWTDNMCIPLGAENPWTRSPTWTTSTSRTSQADDRGIRRLHLPGARRRPTIIDAGRSPTARSSSRPTDGPGEDAHLLRRSRRRTS